MAMRGSIPADSPGSSGLPEPASGGGRRRRLRGRKPKGARLPPGIRGSAILDAERAAWAGQYDEWSFVPETKVAYLERLASECEQAVATDHARAVDQLDAALSVLRRAQRGAGIATRIGDSRLEAASRRRARARDREQASLETLDLIAGTSFARLPVPWFEDNEDEDEAGAVPSPSQGPDDGRDAQDGRDPLGGSGRAGGGGDGHGSGQAGVGAERGSGLEGGAGPGTGADSGHGRSLEDDAGTGRGSGREGGVGAADLGPDDGPGLAAEWSPEQGEGGNGSPGLGSPPVPAGEWADGSFGPAALLGPGAGMPPVPLAEGQAPPGQPGGPASRRAVRARPRWVGPADGRFAMLMPEWLRAGALVLLAAVEIPIYYRIFFYFNAGDPVLTWTFTIPVAVGMVLAPHLAGKLHRRRQEAPGEPLTPFLTAFVMGLWLIAGCLLGWLRQAVLLVPHIDPLTGQQIGLTSQLHVTWWTMTGVFASVLLLSGLIAFMLGVGEAHPIVAGYHAAVRASEDAEEVYEAAVRAHAEAAEPIRESEDEIRAGSQAKADHREQALRAEYSAAAEAYLDAVARELGDPNITQATGAALWDKLPGLSARPRP